MAVGASVGRAPGTSVETDVGTSTRADCCGKPAAEVGRGANALTSMGVTVALGISTRAQWISWAVLLFAGMNVANPDPLMNIHATIPRIIQITKPTPSPIKSRFL